MKTHSKKKGAIELSMTTIIVVVIGITMLTLGLAWIKDTFSNIDELGQGAFDAADALLQDTMTSDALFHISGMDFDASPGELSSAIGVGVRNNIGDGGTKAILSVTTVGGDICSADWILVPTDAVTAPEGEIKAIPIKIKISKGTAVETLCFFEITAKNENNNLYGSEVISVTVV